MQEKYFKMIIDELIIQMIKYVKKLSEEKASNRYIKKYPIEKVLLLLLLQQYSGFDIWKSFQPLSQENDHGLVSGTVARVNDGCSE